MNDSYKFWREALEGNFNGFTDEPQAGFYRVRESRGGPFVPVAIWFEGLMPHILENGKVVLHDDFIWMFCAQNPITKEVYDDFMAGKGWPDQVSVPQLGHNNPPMTPSEKAQSDIEALAAEAMAFIKDGVTTEKQADKASNYLNLLRTLASDAEKKRKLEKYPHLEASKAVDALWGPIIAAVREPLGALKSAVGKYLAVEQKLADAEWAAKAAQIEAAKDAEVEPVGPAADPVVKRKPAPPPKVKAGTQFRAVSLRQVKVAVIIDPAKALEHFKDTSEVKTLVQQLANRIVKAGGSVPGVEIQIEEIAV